MLVVSRREGECIKIGTPPNDITIKIVVIHKARGEAPRVRVGINAPRSIPVHREEVATRIAIKEAGR